MLILVACVKLVLKPEAEKELLEKLDFQYSKPATASKCKDWVRSF